jgi:hypothetical protein
MKWEQSKSSTTFTNLLTLALKTPRLIVCPAQFRTSVANKVGSGLSCILHQQLVHDFPAFFAQLFQENSRSSVH